MISVYARYSTIDESIEKVPVKIIIDGDKICSMFPSELTYREGVHKEEFVDP